jgi:hypothetical protein
MVMDTAGISAKMEQSAGIHRSRFFLRFNTARRRRVLIVQLVSVEISSDEDDTRQAANTKSRLCRTWGESYNNLLHVYRTGLLLGRT